MRTELHRQLFQEVNRRRDALIVVDVQNDFLPGGSLAVAGGNEIVPGIVDLLRMFDTVVATQDWHPIGHAGFAASHGKPVFSEIKLHDHPQTLWPVHCVAGNVGAQIADYRIEQRADMILRKGSNPNVDSYSAFRENYGADGWRADTGLRGYLSARGIYRCFHVGLARDYCVKFSAIDAAECFKSVFIWDLTRAVDTSKDAATRSELESMGVRVIG